MKKTVAALAVAVVVEAIALVYLLFIREPSYKEGEKWFAANSPSKENFCRVEAYYEQPDSPLAPNAPAKVAVSVSARGKELARFTANVDNNGEPLDDSNYSVEWFDDYVLIKLYDRNKKYSAYRFYYDD